MLTKVANIKKFQVPKMRMRHILNLSIGVMICECCFRILWVLHVESTKIECLALKGYVATTYVLELLMGQK